MGHLPEFQVGRVFSAGWGTQSTAVLVLQAMGKLPKPYDVFAFANVGTDSENPETLTYYEQHIKPFATQHGIHLAESQRLYFGKPISLYEFMLTVESSQPLPLYFSETGKGKRICTVDFKIEVLNRWIKQYLKMPYVEIGIGFSVDEFHRTRKKYPDWHSHNWTRQENGSWRRGKRLGYWRKHEYPLIELGIKRQEAIRIVERAGLPSPPRSLCWFCPFQGRNGLLDKKKHSPETFRRILDLEDLLNERYQKRTGQKKSRYVTFHPDRIRTREMPDQKSLWDALDGECDLGVCGV